MKIPVWITNRNRYKSVIGIINYLATIPDVYPIIIDNASTYSLLLTWYKGIENVEVIYKKKNGSGMTPF